MSNIKLSLLHISAQVVTTQTLHELFEYIFCCTYTYMYTSKNDKYFDYGSVVCWYIAMHSLVLNSIHDLAITILVNGKFMLSFNELLFHNIVMFTTWYERHSNKQQLRYVQIHTIIKLWYHIWQLVVCRTHSGEGIYVSLAEWTNLPNMTSLPYSRSV